MRAFAAAILGIVVVAVASYVVLQQVQEPVSVAFTGSGARLIPLHRVAGSRLIPGRGGCRRLRGFGELLSNPEIVVFARPIHIDLARSHSAKGALHP